MRVAIMQPYFLSYIGYWQLIAAVDTFVVYDHIKYTKKGWINRNRLLHNGDPTYFTLPLQHAPDSALICNRELDPNFDLNTLYRRFEGAYRHAPYRDETLGLLETILHDQNGRSLFWFLYDSIKRVCVHLRVGTEIIISSDLEDGNTYALKGQERVLNLCRVLHATDYINPSGGVELYDREEFRRHGVNLSFLRPLPLVYEQLYGEMFCPWLSIIDVLMFNPLKRVREIVRTNWELF